MVAGNLGFTGELKTRLQTIKTWPYDMQFEASDPALQWVELEGSSSQINEIASKAVEILQANSCQILVLASGGSFRCQAVYWNRAATQRPSLPRDFHRVQNYLQRVILSDNPVLLDHKDHYVPQEERVALHVQPSDNLLLIPMRIQTEPVGVFMLAFKTLDLSMEKVKQALVFADQASKALQREGLYYSEEVSIIELVMVLGEAMRTWDPTTSRHCHNLTSLAEKTAIKMGCDFHDIQVIRRAAFLHDIGKMGIPDQILLKPSQLNEREWAIMRQHPRRGANILRTIAGLAEVAHLVEAHHEHFDGSGYPYGLRGEQIPLGARILAVVDAFTAMTEDRVYRPARSQDEAIAELIRCSGTDFDPKVVKAFLSLQK
jgi:putative nucleotidyltransferase with HDIG domain